MDAFYVSAVACVATVGGGLTALLLRSHRVVVLAFCAGALVAIAMLHLLPEALGMLRSTSDVLVAHELLAATASGFFVTYLVHRRSRSAERDAGDRDGGRAGWWGATGIAVHSFFDGFLVGQAFRAGTRVGWTIALTVLLHKLTEGVTAVGVMLGSSQSPRAAGFMVALTALAPVAGVAAQSYVSISTAALALLLGFFAGVFLYLGAAHLLPESTRLSSAPMVPVAALFGFAFVWLVRLLTP